MFLFPLCGVVTRSLFCVTYLVTYHVTPGTTANVSIEVVGESGSSGPRALFDPERPVFKAGSVDHFVLTTAGVLGKLSHIRSVLVELRLF